MSDVHRIAKALLNGGEESSRMVPCEVCAKPAPLPDFIWESVRLWNRQELAFAESANRKVDFIATNELGMTCSQECNAELFRRKHEQYQRDAETTLTYFGMLCAGKYNPESLAWLRAHGMAKRVEQILEKEGTGKANQPKGQTEFEERRHGG